MPGSLPGARVLAPWRKLRRKTREVGWLYTAQLLLEVLIPEGVFAINKQLITLHDPRIRSGDELKDARMRIVSAKDLASLDGAETWPSHLRFLLEDGDDAAIFERDGRLIAYRTFSTDRYDPSDWLRLILPPDAVRTGFVWTAPDLRGRGINLGTRNALARYQAENGVKYCFSWIDALNRNSLRSHEKFGGYIGAIFFVRLFGLTLVRTNGAFKLGIWGPKRPLEIRVDPSASRTDLSASGPQGSLRR